MKVMAEGLIEFFIVLLVIIVTIGALIGTLYLTMLGHAQSENNRIDSLNEAYEMSRFNRLYHCTACNRYSRHYQIRLVSASKNSTGWFGCPHCEDTDELINEVWNEDKWMENHPDCIKVPRKEIKKIEKLIHTIKQAKEDDQETERFLAYNKLKHEVSWLENIHKELSKKEIQDIKIENNK